MSRWIVGATASILMLLLSCAPDLKVEEFSNLVGCYRTGSGQFIMKIEDNGEVTDQVGRPLAKAFLRTQGHSSQLQLRPGLVLTADRQQLVTAENEVNTHLLLPLPQALMIGLISHDERPPELLTRSRAPCE